MPKTPSRDDGPQDGELATDYVRRITRANPIYPPPQPPPFRKRIPTDNIPDPPVPILVHAEHPMWEMFNRFIKRYQTMLGVVTIAAIGGAIALQVDSLRRTLMTHNATLANVVTVDVMDKKFEGLISIVEEHVVIRMSKKEVVANCPKITTRGLASIPCPIDGIKLASGLCVVSGVIQMDGTCNTNIMLNKKPSHQ